MHVRDGDGSVLGGELAALDLGTDDVAVDAGAVVQLVALGGREQGDPLIVRHLEAEGVEPDAAALLPVVGVPRLWVGSSEEAEVVRNLRDVGADPSGFPSLLPERVRARAGVHEELLDRLARALGGRVAVLVGNDEEDRDGLAPRRVGVAAAEDGGVDDLGEGGAGLGAADLAGVQPDLEGGEDLLVPLLVGVGAEAVIDADQVGDVGNVLFSGDDLLGHRGVDHGHVRGHQ
mmetsp:Transcript_5683/g.26265  ORF Transcript_5683/g.26265 Transcript_5683/m.26265 type:complete len:232 (+) Transcript_5683:1737-2432(+)